MSLLFQQRTILLFLMYPRKSVSIMNQGWFDYPKCTHSVKFYPPPIISKLFLIMIHATFHRLEIKTKTRMHSSRMRTSRLPTVCVFVATTRCQYQRVVGIPCDLGYPHSGHTHPHWTYQPLDIFTPWTYPSSLLLVTRCGHHYPHGQTDTCENITFPQLRLRAVITKKNPLPYEDASFERK